MEALTRLVAESLARHGLDRPVDPRRLQWSRWSRCDSPHSLLVVPSKPGIFALAEEVANFDAGTGPVGTCDGHSGTAALSRPSESSSALPAVDSGSDFSSSTDRQGLDQGLDREGHDREGHNFTRAETGTRQFGALAPDSARRMLAVLQFSEDDDMAFVLDRMFTRPNPMRARLASGRCFLRFVVIEDQAQRRSICSALNQWMISSAEKASGISADFASSLELTDRVGQPLSANAAITTQPAQAAMPKPRADPAHPDVRATAPHLNSGAATNIHCPRPLPSGF